MDVFLGANVELRKSLFNFLRLEDGVLQTKLIVDRENSFVWFNIFPLPTYFLPKCYDAESCVQYAVIPCSRIFPVVDSIDESLFKWKNSQNLNFTNFSSCKLIFRLRYHPTNNHWNPFVQFKHTFAKFITVEWGIHVQESETRPTGFQPVLVLSLLTDTVKRTFLITHAVLFVVMLRIFAVKQDMESLKKVRLKFLRLQ